MPRGPARTDCFIARARIASQKADLAYDKARAPEDSARLQAATGISAKRELCRNNVAGTRVLYVLSHAQPLGIYVPSQLQEVVFPPLHPFSRVRFVEQTDKAENSRAAIQSTLSVTLRNAY